MARVLMVSSDPAPMLSGALREAGHEPLHAVSIRAAIQAIETAGCELVVAELELCDGNSRDLLERVAADWPELPVVVIAAESAVPRAIDAMRQGAADFLRTPFVREEVAYVATKALTKAGSTAAVQRPLSTASPKSALLGQSAPMATLRELAQRAASSSATVLIRGESGTGKELVARGIHAASERRGQAFLKIDCASLPDALLESELFGYERGAFTGAVGRKLGRVELADGGTLFLDEIGEVSAVMQAKLLRLLQDRAFERLGGKQTIRIDVRFILATHRDLETMVGNGSFRQDLFYRINVVPLWLPPLRARREDIELLANEFCAKFAAENHKPLTRISGEALRLLRTQRWPGNVRQLENFIERLVVLSPGPKIQDEDVQRELLHRPQFSTQATETEGKPAFEPRPAGLGVLDDAVRLAERRAVLVALERTAGNRSAAARVLGVSRATLYNKLRELGID